MDPQDLSLLRTQAVSQEKWGKRYSFVRIVEKNRKLKISRFEEKPSGRSVRWSFFMQNLGITQNYLKFNSDKTVKWKLKNEK